MSKLVVVPHNMGSRGAKALAEILSNKLGYKVWRVTPDKVKGRHPFLIQTGTDKLTQLNSFNSNEVECPEFTQDRTVALGWIRDGSVVMCRTLLRASEGRGIVVAETEDQLVNARLYTKYVPKKQEFRVHVLQGQVIDVQMKKKRKGFEDERNTRIRNLANGYVFCREGIVEPPQLRQLAINATRSLGYPVGAVDIAFNVKKERLVVLEVNAAPGLQGRTLEIYSNAIVAGLPMDVRNPPRVQRVPRGGAARKTLRRNVLGGRS
jgi:glutathione synthase/RimK-type ligase-like ATP-grasp enzyme